MRGTFGKQGGAGGNGGIGGIGGYSGEVVTLGVLQQPEIVVTAANGENGKDGIGGKAGTGGRHGRDYKITVYGGSLENGVVKDSYWSKDQNRGEFLRRWPQKASDGSDGSSGLNNIGQELPNRSTLKTAYHIINKFKTLSRENIKQNPKATKLLEFTYQLETNPEVTKLYDTFGLMEDLQDLEKQFYNRNEDISLLPFYTSLLNRIHEYAENPNESENSDEYKRVLHYLYTATLSKTCYLKNNIKNDLIIDLNKYLDVTMNDINSFKEIYNEVKIKEYQTEHHKAISAKINEAKDFIDSQVVPQINNLFIEVEDKISLLINETSLLLENKKKEKYEKIKLQSLLGHSLTMEGLLRPLKSLSQILGLLGPIGETVSATVGPTALISHTLMTEEISTTPKSTTVDLPAAVKTSISEIPEVFKNEELLLSQQLNDVDDHLTRLKNDSSGVFELIKSNFNNLQQKFKTNVGNNTIDNFTWIDNIRNEIINFFNKQKKHFEQENNENVKVINDILDIVGITKIAVNIYKEFKDDQDKVSIVSEELKKINAEIAQITLYEREIYKLVIPLCENMKKITSTVEEESRNKSHVALDVKNWQIQSFLKSVRLTIQRQIKGFTIEEDFIKCIENIEEAITTVINVYDRIQDFHDTSELSVYIVKITSTNELMIVDNNEKLKTTLYQLDLMIKSNIILEQYSKAIYAFKQNVFPFAHHYLEQFSLPTSFTLSNNTEELVSITCQKIKHLQNILATSSSVVNKQKEELHEMIFSSNQTLPFFVWNYEANKNSVSDILEGLVVSFKADVTKSLKQNAVKFKQIGMHFKLRDKSKQKEFDTDLEDFNISMTHAGFSYYRCHNRFFVITSSPITFVYSFKKDKQGNPLSYNTIYSDVKNNNYVLSPYTMWLIKLTPASWVNLNEIHNIFKKLSKYKDEFIDIELEGYGQYLKKESTVCNENLEEYYKLDDTLSELNHIDISNDHPDIPEMIDDISDDQEEVYNRERRSKITDENTYATSGSSGTTKLSLINNFANMFRNTLNFISNTNLLSLPFANRFLVEDVNCELPKPINTENEPKYELFNEKTTDNNNNLNNISFNMSNVHGNLLLLDMVVRKKNGNKNSFKTKRSNPHYEYAQLLAYQGYANEKKG